MALAMIDNILPIVRMSCICFCGFALVMYLGNKHIPFNTVTKWGLGALATQIVLSLAELAVPTCFGLALLPNHLGLSLLIILMDFLVASFVIAMGWANIGIFIQKMYKGVCLKPCKVSFVYGLLVLMGGGLGYIAMLCNLTVAAKMNLLRQAQD